MAWLGQAAWHAANRPHSTDKAGHPPRAPHATTPSLCAGARCPLGCPRPPPPRLRHDRIKGNARARETPAGAMLGTRELV